MLRLKTLLYGSELHPRQQPPGILPVAPYPPQTGPWSGAACLGQKTLFPLKSGSRVTALQLPEWGFPQVWTVALGVELPDVNWVVTPGVRIYADVVAGTGGSTQEFTVNWDTGVMFSLPMNALTVTARVENTTHFVTANAQLSITLSRGTRANASYPSLTYIRAAVGAGADSYPEPIPHFTRRLTLAGVNNAVDVYNAASYLQFSAKVNAAGDLTGRIPTAALLTNPDGVAIPGLSRSVYFHNGSLNNIFPSWNFQLGI